MTTARVTHATRGRMRVRLAGRRSEVAEAMAGLRDLAEREAAVHTVESDPGRGSALLVFDPEHLSVEELIARCRKAHPAFAELVPPDVAAAVGSAGSSLSRRVRLGLGAADRRVHVATAGALDLRVLVPIGLAAVAVRQLARTGPRIPQIPWYVLAWYSFDSFVKLHGVQPTLVEGPAA